MIAKSQDQQTVLVVLDGFGIGLPGPGNAIQQSKPAFIEGLLTQYPHTQLDASGESVGLPDTESGNTEVGHTNLGAGRIVYQSLPRINMAITDGTFFSNTFFLKAKDHIANTGGALHLLGLIGGQHVHSSVDHLYALLEFAKKQAISDVYIHVITDGRDSPPRAAKTYLTTLESKIQEIGVGRIASIMGRYYAMDRDKRWSRLQKAYECLLHPQADSTKPTHWREYIDKSYADNISDEFIVPTALYTQGEAIGRIHSGDSVIFYNYRIDRPRELTKAFVLPDFEKEANTTTYDPYANKYIAQQRSSSKQPEEVPFKRSEVLKNLCFVTMTEYEHNLPVQVAFPPHTVNYPIGRVLAEHGLAQLRIAESEKERFVTYYFNGLRESPFPREERRIVPSPKVPTYDMKPEMSAVETTKQVIQGVVSRNYQFILINYANPDMVGHTGDIEAAKKAVHTVDECLKKLVEASLPLNTTVVITADHGNAEQMIDPKTGKVETEHTSNRVPCIIVDRRLTGRGIQLQTGILADVAPTLLFLMRIPKPREMTGRNLLEEIGGEV